jgi:hypothetical protein
VGTPDWPQAVSARSIANKAIEENNLDLILQLP